MIAMWKVTYVQGWVKTIRSEILKSVAAAQSAAA